MMIAAGGGKPIALSDGRYLHMSPAWLPDGRHLLFMSSQDGGRDIYALKLTDDGHARGAARRLTTGLAIGTFSISADASVLAYSSFPNTSNVWSVPIAADHVITDADATPVTSGTQRIEGIAVSRDGQWLAFDSDRRSSNPAIYRMPIGGGEPQQVTSGTSMDFVPSFSPDGNEILFQSWRNETRDVYLVPVGGGEETLVAGGPDQEMYADWSPDGRSVVFDRKGIGPHELFVVTRDGAGRWGAPRQLTRGGGRFPRWSPDGRWTVYVYGANSLRIIPSEGGEPRELVTVNTPAQGSVPPDFAIWSPDSRRVFYRGRWAGMESFWSVPVDGGPPKLLARFGPRFNRAHFMFATDGKRLYFTVRDHQSDLKVMQLARLR
jgi:Tol biopolymer transport system component